MRPELSIKLPVHTKSNTLIRNIDKWFPSCSIITENRIVISVSNKMKVDSAIFREWNRYSEQWENSTKIELAYENQHIKYSDEYNWSESTLQWRLFYRHEYEYNEINKLATSISYHMDEDTGELVYEGKKEYAYNDDDLIKSLTNYYWNTSLEEYQSLKKRI